MKSHISSYYSSCSVKLFEGYMKQISWSRFNYMEHLIHSDHLFSSSTMSPGFCSFDVASFGDDVSTAVFGTFRVFDEPFFIAQLSVFLCLLTGEIRMYG